MSDGYLKLDALILQGKGYVMLNRVAVSGGSYYDWLDAVYGDEHWTQCETPMYEGGLSKELIFSQVVSNSGTEEQPLATIS